MNKKIRFIGDLHGDLKAWKFLINEDNYEYTIVLGDFGAGFVKVPDEKEIDMKHKFIRGNHDDPQACKESSRWISDGTFWDEYSMMFVGGAYSIDREYRTIGIDWWEDEELSYQELEKMINLYINYKPRIMVTHDFPHSVAEKLFRGMGGYPIKATRTSYALDKMLYEHQPEIWLGGHWHESKNIVIDKTRFICCNINEAIDINFTKTGEKND